MNPKITVLMTVYNGEKYLKECISSALSQNFENFEFLIIDDSSTDSSLDIIKSCKDSRIRVIENDKNLGQVKSLNIGLGHARGEYIARIDQDDVMLKNRLQRQADFLDKNPEIAVVGAWAIVIDEKGKEIEKSRFPVTNGEIISYLLFGGYFLMHPSVMFRKDCVIKAGKYDEAVSFAEDYDLWVRLLLKKYKLANIPEFLIKFRYHKESSSKRFLAVQSANAQAITSNFVRSIMGVESESDLLNNTLINVESMNKKYWMNEANTAHIEKNMALLENVLEKTIKYFSFKKNEIYQFKSIFFSKILNFAYKFCAFKKKNHSLYFFCLRNYHYLFTKPKLYLYPLKSVL